MTFSVIGDDEIRSFVIYGQPIEELKRTQKISLANDLILSSSAWQHCTPSHYEYVIKDLYNIKVELIVIISSLYTSYLSIDFRRLVVLVHLASPKQKKDFTPTIKS